MNGVAINRKTLCDIAQVAFEVINYLLSLDQNFARKLRSRATGSRQIIREETITETLTCELLSKFPEHVELTLFTQPEEAQTGADWYWRIERGTDAIHARVQAKRLQRSEFGDSDDIGHIAIDTEQLHRLLLVTQREATRIPGLEAWFAVYARINATPPCGCDILQECSHHLHAGLCRNEQPSMWIANAQDIAKLRSRRMTIEQIVQNLLRLDCVLPCIDIDRSSHPEYGEPDSAGVPGPARKGFVLQSNLWSYQECVALIENDEQLRMQFRGALRIKL